MCAHEYIFKKIQCVVIFECCEDYFWTVAIKIDGVMIQCLDGSWWWVEFAIAKVTKILPRTSLARWRFHLSSCHSLSMLWEWDWSFLIFSFCFSLSLNSCVYRQLVMCVRKDYRRSILFISHLFALWKLFCPRNNESSYVYAHASERW